MYKENEAGMGLSTGHNFEHASHYFQYEALKLAWTCQYCGIVLDEASYFMNPGITLALIGGLRCKGANLVGELGSSFGQVSEEWRSLMLDE